MTKEKKIKLNSIEMYNSFCQKLKSEETLPIGNDSNFDESDTSEIFIEDEVDYSSFAKDIFEPKRVLISEDSIEFETNVKIQGLKIFNELAVVFPKVQSTPN